MENETNNKKSNKLLIIIIIILIIIVGTIGTIILLKNNKKSKNEDTTTTTTNSTEVTTTIENEEEKKFFNEEIYTIIKENDENITFKLNYYYEKINNYTIFEDGDYKETDGYQLTLEIESNGFFFGKYKLVQGKKINNIVETLIVDKLTFAKEKMIRSIKDKKSRESYLLITVPEDINTGVKREYVTTPKIYTNQGDLVTTIKTAYDEYGYTYIKDSKYNLNEQNVLNNKASYYFDSNNSELYFIEEMKCLEEKNYEIVADIKKLTVENGKVVITTYVSNVDADGVGASC